MADFTRLSSTVVQSTNGNTKSTTAIDTSGAALLVAVVISGDTHPTFSDSASNTWTAGPTATGSQPDIATYYCISPTTSATHTVTATVTGGFPAVSFFAYSSTGTVTLDTSNKTEGVNSTLNAGSVTPSQANCLLLAGVANGGGGTVTADSGFTTVNNVGTVGGQAFGMTDAEQIQTTATTRNPLFGTSDNVLTGGAILVFKAAAAAGDPFPAGYQPAVIQQTVYRL